MVFILAELPRRYDGVEPGPGQVEPDSHEGNVLEGLPAAADAKAGDEGPGKGNFSDIFRSQQGNEEPDVAEEKITNKEGIEMYEFKSRGRTTRKTKRISQPIRKK